ncbi:MAG: hypothetical protein GX762_04860, partial [Bacteroidales bacterium]|nr:hypothetical protein [Bacteroidales bacterium]
LYYPTDKNELNFYGKSAGDYDYSTQYYVKDLNGDYVLHHTDTFSAASGVSLTDEDCYEIRGFTYYSRKNYNNSRIAKIYYTRNNYSLEFYYKSTELESNAEIPFEKPLSSYDFTPTNAQAGLPDYYGFAGWYTSKDCVDGSEYDLSTNTMPSNNVKLYAKFDIQEKTVNFETNGGTTIDSQNIKAGDKIDRPENPSLEGSEFVGWYEDESTTILYDFSAPVMNDITLYAKWIEVTETTYSIRYVDEEGETVFPTRENIAGIVGKEVKATALYSLTIVPDAAFKTLVLSYDKTINVITFTYSAASEQSYTIKYLKNSDNTKLAEPFTDTTMYSQISVIAKNINGYYPNKATHLLSLSSGINEYAFHYTPIEYNINYNLNGGAVMGNPSSYTIEDELTLVNPTKEGSIFTGWTGSNGDTPNKSVNVSVGTTGNLTYTANWKAKTAIKLTAKSQTKTYDGEPLTNSGYNLDGTLEEGDTLDVDVNGSITDAGETSNEIMSYTVKDSDGNDITGNYLISIETGTLKVNKAEIKVAAASKSKPFDGIALTDDTFKTTGDLVTGQTVDATVTGSILNAGTTDNVISNIKVKDGTTDVTSNYSITPENGTLTITQATNPDVTFTAAGYTGT